MTTTVAVAPAGLAAAEASLNRRATADELAREEELVHAAAASDEGAFAVIYERHARGLYGYALGRLADPARAEDLVQEVFLALVRTGSSYRARAPLHAFLYRVARNRILNLRRDARPEVELQERAASRPAIETVVAVREVLARLPDLFREPILLATYQQLTYEEIAAVLACPVGTVRSRISRGKRMMAEWLIEKK